MTLFHLEGTRKLTLPGCPRAQFKVDRKSKLKLLKSKWLSYIACTNEIKKKEKEKEKEKAGTEIITKPTAHSIKKL